MDNSKKMMDIKEDLFNSVNNDLNDKMNKVIVLGLNKKGYFFNNNVELKDFVVKNCVIEENSFNNTQHYKVNGVPFMMFIKNINPIDYSENISSNYTYSLGSYKYL